MSSIFKNMFIVFAMLMSACSSQDSKTDSDIKENSPYDAIYVISLDRTPLRFNDTKGRLNVYGLEPARFSAVDGLCISLTNKIKGEVISGKEAMLNVSKTTWDNRPSLYHVSYNGKYKEAEFDLLLKYSKFSAGEIGVTFSHRAIWADIIKNKYKKAIVFEDDVIPLKNFKNNLFELLKNIPNDSDITFISIGVRKDKSCYYPDIDKNFMNFDAVEDNNFVVKIQPTNRVYGMFAYVVGENGARKLIEETNLLQYPLDDVIFQKGGIDTGKINGYVSKKKICSVSFSNSEIKKMGRSY